ncbi:MAG: hypothetical protein ACTH07_12030 [Microbacterium sp.]
MLPALGWAAVLVVCGVAGVGCVAHVEEPSTRRRGRERAVHATGVVLLVVAMVAAMHTLQAPSSDAADDRPIERTPL